MSLSKRGHDCIRSPPEYLRIVFESFADIYDASSNPMGVLILAVAENRLSLPLVAEKLNAAPPIPPSELTYTWMHGSNEYRTAVAAFLARYVTFRPVRMQEVLSACGGGAVIDLLATVLCDDGDRVLVTGPGYRGLERDLDGRAGVEVEVAHLDAADGWPVTTVHALEEAWQRAGAEQSRIRALLLCTPGNPTGEVLSRQLVLDIVAWGRSRGLHLVFDEAYALSVYGETEFVSVAEVLDGHLGNDVHVVWTFSKDFCVSGLRMGVLYSQNEAVLESLTTFLTYFAGVSRESQWSLRHMLEDESWMEGYICENKRRLREGYTVVTEALDSFDVPYMNADAGFFVWADLRKWMKGEGVEAEIALWQRIVDVKVLLTPASECFGIKYGFFRICFAAVELDGLVLALEKLGKVLAELS